MNRLWLWITIALSLLLSLIFAAPALAGGPPQQSGDNGACLACHGQSNLTYKFPSGEVWSLYVDQNVFRNSVHGEQGLACTACHTDISGYPHPPLKVGSIRDFQLQEYQTCKQCHQAVYQQSLDSIHAQQIAAGNFSAAICTDCHGAHDTTPPDKPRTKIPRTCSKCHSAIYNDYLTSVHGQALVDNSNPDVPTCINCHGVHNQEDPRTTQFRLNSPKLCATCHANKAMMSKYNISTNVFQTYVADFHGTTVTLFQRESPDQQTNAPVCYDCHGVHDMKSPSDPTSQVYRANLLKTCQKCHPDATQNFSASWLSHYEPDVDKYPLVYFVDLFYKIFIPAVLGFMGLYVVIDVGGRVTRRLRRTKNEEAD
jgi:predicted CXXCH cytochrome family protein